MPLEKNMNREQARASAEGYHIHILSLNGKACEYSTDNSYAVENIGKGGFRFVADIAFELDDRVQVSLRFPDGHCQEVLGRICYNDINNDGINAYGFSIIEGFYSLRRTA